MILLLGAALIGFSIHGITYLPIRQEKNDGVDYDLTQYNRDMRYACVANIMNNPEDYIDKTIKANGAFFAYPLGKNSWRYAVFISDTMGCCSAGIPMIMPEDFEKPDNGSPITVSGTLRYVTYAGKQQISLQDVKLKVEQS